MILATPCLLDMFTRFKGASSGREFNRGEPMEGPKCKTSRWQLPPLLAVEPKMAHRLLKEVSKDFPMGP